MTKITYKGVTYTIGQCEAVEPGYGVRCTLSDGHPEVFADPTSSYGHANFSMGLYWEPSENNTDWGGWSKA